MLHSFFFETAAKQPIDSALWVDGASWTYAALSEHSQAVTSRLRSSAPVQASRCLLFAYRSIHAYSGLLGILNAGMAYMPLNPKFPSARNASIIERSGCDVLLVDKQCEAALKNIIPLLATPPQIIQLNDIGSVLPPPVSSHIDRNPEESGGEKCIEKEQDLAYILFTSGTTGEPKGVQITHASACAYVQGLRQLYATLPPMRHTQMFDLTFDLSVHDLFVCWAAGGCLYVPSDADLMQPGEFIKQHNITDWFSVPSVASFMAQFRKLKPSAYPSIRMSMFCGEALPPVLAEIWQQATPNGRVINLYGPTEATIAFTHYELPGTISDVYDLAALPIGSALPGQEVVIVDENLNPVEKGDIGELLLGGSQLSMGYISDNALDHQKFFDHVYPGKLAQRWYHTGDLASESLRWGLLFHGRLDSQIKLRGYRVELQEIEHTIRSVSKSPMCAVIAWPIDKNDAPLGLVGFVSMPSCELSTNDILVACRSLLPEYACPERLIHIDTFPLNSNGKIDRACLRDMAENELISP